MLEAVTRAGSRLSPTEDGIKALRELAYDSFEKISSHQLPNKLIPASLGRHDDGYFDRGVWVKDHVRATRFALDHLVQQSLPELTKTGQDLYLGAIRGILRVLDQPEQQRRFGARPGQPNAEGYSSIADQDAPAIKFNSDGSIYYDWGHNQPDNWGTLLLETAKGIDAGWPVLERATDGFIPGEVLQDIISYAVHLRTERLLCRSIWEHDVVKSSYSTRRIILASLHKIDTIWPEIDRDSIDNGYPLSVSQEQIRDAVGNLTERVQEHQGDYTDTEGHHQSSADLASLVVLNDIDNLPGKEQQEILRSIKEAELENRRGFYRYFGDHWKLGSAEAKWTMGKPIMARLYFRRAINLYESGNSKGGHRALDHGLDRMNDLLDIISEYGYVPELFEDEDGDGIFKPNNNELAWTSGYTIEAAGAGIAAITASGLIK